MLRTMITQLDSFRIEGIASSIGAMLPNKEASLLDVGCGSGTLGQRILRDRPWLKIQGVEVIAAQGCCFPVTIYNGSTLPFEDDTFDVVLCSDMLHHTASPQAVLHEAARVAKDCVVLKDHVAQHWLDHAHLRLLDWIGNVGTAVPMPYNYLSHQKWLEAFSYAHVEPVAWKRNIRHWPFPLSTIFDRRVHFAVKLRPIDLDG